MFRSTRVSFGFFMKSRKKVFGINERKKDRMMVSPRDQGVG